MLAALLWLSLLTACPGRRGQPPAAPAVEPGAPEAPANPVEPEGSSGHQPPPEDPATEPAADPGGRPFQDPTMVAGRAHPAATVATAGDLRAASHRGFDRVVIELDSLPGYRVSWSTAPPPQCGSGEPTVMPGAAFLVAQLEPARAHDDPGRSTLSQRTAQPGLPAIAALAISCDFEATLTLAIGAPRALPFRVLALEQPPRLAIDLRHP